MKPIKLPVILRQIARKGEETDVIQAAASMAFYTLFSMFPLILLLISIGSTLLKDQGTVARILDFVSETLPAARVLVKENITNLVQQRGTIGLVGFVSLLWSASNVFTTLSAHINSAWPSSKKRNYLETRLVGLGIVGAMVVALVGYVLGTILLQLITQLRVPLLGYPGLSDVNAWGWVWSLLSWLLVLGLLFGIYLWVPKTHVPWQAALTSGAITTLILMALSRILSSLFALIIHHYELVYGSLAAFVAFMFYIYMINLVVLTGAHLSVAISNITHPAT